MRTEKNDESVRKAETMDSSPPDNPADPKIGYPAKGADDSSPPDNPGDPKTGYPIPGAEE